MSCYPFEGLFNSAREWSNQLHRLRVRSKLLPCIFWFLEPSFRSLHEPGFVLDAPHKPVRPQGLLQDQDDGAEAILRQTELGLNRTQTDCSNLR